MNADNPILAYFRSSREKFATQYKQETRPYQRRDARRWVLHYGRLIRKLERRAA